jgi:hypothetical protein
LWLGAKYFYRGFDGIWQQFIVGKAGSDDIARASIQCFPKSFGRAGVRLRHESDTAPVALEYFESAVGRGAVLNDEFNILIRLVENAFDASSNGVRAILTE